MPNLFVYGTLKKGFHNHELITEFHPGSVPVITTLAGFQLRQDGLPYMIRTDNPDDTVTGELYQINEECLALLDMLEGHPHWYRREYVTDEIQAYVMPLERVSPHAHFQASGIYTYENLSED